MTPDKTFPIDIKTYNKLCEDRANLLKALEEFTDSLAQSRPKRIMAHTNALLAIAKAKAES